MKEVTNLKEQNVKLENRTADLERKTTEMERCKRSWNVRLNGLNEKKDENTRELTVDLLLKIVPHWKEETDWILDTVHRLGKSSDLPRQIIKHFTARIYRDELWRATKRHPIFISKSFILQKISPRKTMRQGDMSGLKWSKQGRRVLRLCLGVPMLTLTDREWCPKTVGSRFDIVQGL
ncbi:hypothetical protein AMECASPLE_038941 [Ameca splendens]|uniref:Uncharacterized protein n=1 Tax=Ameca splendens TaxID=208324 RepID=A0ABV0Z677_9TELE